MLEPRDFDEFEPLEPWGEDFEDEYFDGEDLDIEALLPLDDLDEEEWERF